MKKEAKEIKSSSKDPNNFGVWSMIIGMLSVMSSSVPVVGIIFAIVGFFLSTSQEKREKNSWSKAGKILSILGAVFSILMFFFSLWLSKNPEILARLNTGAQYATP